MDPPRILALVLVFAFVLTQAVRAQQVVSPTAFDSTVNANGMLLAENDAAIEQSRLYRQATPPNNLGVDANGTPVAATETTTSDDDSFGAQLILKSQERARNFVVTGGVAVNYTNNVALTRDGTVADGFAVVGAGFAWSPRLGRDLEGSLGFGTSFFRYFDNSALDFESLNFGAGLAWNPPSLHGIGIFTSYNFTELLSTGADQILMEHTLTLGAQKTFPFGRAHGLTIGVIGVAGFSDPSDAQRDQLGAFVNYHLRLTRHLDSELLFRPAAFLYTVGDRVDYTQVLSASLRYHFNDWAELTAFFSYGFNRSNHDQFDYNAVTTGGGIGLNVRF